MVKNSEVQDVLKPEIDWTNDEIRMTNNNSKALNAIFAGVDPCSSN